MIVYGLFLNNVYGLFLKKFAWRGYDGSSCSISLEIRFVLIVVPVNLNRMGTLIKGKLKIFL